MWPLKVQAEKSLNVRLGTTIALEVDVTMGGTVLL